jgi:hypothetical protein
MSSKSDGVVRDESKSDGIVQDECAKDPHLQVGEGARCQKGEEKARLNEAKGISLSKTDSVAPDETAKG